MQARGKRLLQLVSLVPVRHAERVQVARAPHLELRDVASLLDLDAPCILAPCREKEVLDCLGVGRERRGVSDDVFFFFFVVLIQARPSLPSQDTTRTSVVPRTTSRRRGAESFSLRKGQEAMASSPPPPPPTTTTPLI